MHSLNTPIAVLQRAEAVWHSQSLPPYLEFVSKVEDQPEPVLVVVRTKDGAAYTQTMPQQHCSPASEATHLEGMSVGAVCTQPKPVAAPGAHLTGPYGSPLGFCVSNAHCTGVLHDDPFAVSQPEAGNGKVIATVYAYGNTYDVSFGSTAAYLDRPVYDLILRPRFDPKRYQLREILVDASDYRVYQMMYEMPRPNQPDVFLRYDFGPVADFWYLHYICVYIPSRFSGEAGGCTPESTRLSDFAIFVSVPDWYFDPALFQQHKQTP